MVSIAGQPSQSRMLYTIALSCLLLPITPCASADDFAGVRGILVKYCVGCHSKDESKGNLDLSRYQTLEDVKRDIEPWQTMRGMLARDEMPPPDNPQPSQQENRKLQRWLDQLLQQESVRRAKDPGPNLVRRLNNTEYRNSIRALTGVDINPGKHYAPDGAAGEGFLNATEALTTTKEQITKYFEAAKETAARVVFLPDGYRFSQSKFKEDWVNEVLTPLNALHRTYADEFGIVPYETYLRATLVHREDLSTNEISLAEVAKQNGLSPKYLEILWTALRSKGSGEALEPIQNRWKVAKPRDSEALNQQLQSIQSVIWRKRNPHGGNALLDRVIPRDLTLANKRTVALEFGKPDTDITIYFSSAVITGNSDKARVVFRHPRLIGKKPHQTLRKIMLEESRRPSLPNTVEGLRPLRVEDFGRGEGVEENDFTLSGSEIVAVRIPAREAVGRELAVDVTLGDGTHETACIHVDARLTPLPPPLNRGVDWQYRDQQRAAPFLVVGDPTKRKARVQKALDQFRALFPARVCYPGVIVRDTVVTLERFHRADSSLSRLFLDQQQHQRLDRLWTELHFISRDAVQVQESLATLTQGEMAPYKGLQKEVERRATQTLRDWRAAESSQWKQLLSFAGQAFRRPLKAKEADQLRQQYDQLRQQKTSHSVAFRTVVARLLISPHFLFRVEREGSGKDNPIDDWELATRLSYFLWAAPPDRELQVLAAAGKLTDDATLTRQVMRMLEDKRSRALATEFGAQWLGVRDFDQFQGKDTTTFPEFTEALRKDMYEESVRFLHDLFSRDRKFSDLLSSDRVFVNDRLARHYGIDKVEGSEFREVSNASRAGRGGILTLGSVLSKHSGASRTSPVLRGNWISEALLGVRLPRPPDDVPKLPKSEAEGELTIRQLVERHTKLPQCASCHQRIDPLGFALEQYDTIGRLRHRDAKARPIDARAKVDESTQFNGITGLRLYLTKTRRREFTRQFCRKLVGYGLGRRTLLSDSRLIDQMTDVLKEPDARISQAIIHFVLSRQFRYARGIDFKR